MSMTLQYRIAIIGIFALIILIPVTSFVISYRARTQTKAKASQTDKSKPVPNTLPGELTSPLEDLKKNLEGSKSAATSTSTKSTSDSGSAAITFGPTLNLKLSIEGRPVSNQSTKLFLGIAQGNPAQNPSYLLTFTVDVPQSGVYQGVSLAGLTVGDTYTAYLKGQAQITAQKEFIMNSSVTDLATVSLTTGDLNEDNIIDTIDYDIAQAAVGATSTSSKWNPLIDFNLDGIINIFDVSIILKHIGTTGDSGPYISTPATQSGILKKSNIGGPGNTEGYWFWVPKI